MDTSRTRRQGERGFTLLEAVISLSILLVGILGMMQLQIIGVTSDAGARAHTTALQLARELAASLEKLEVKNTALAEHYVALTPPAEFGHLVRGDGTLVTSGFTAWSDASPLAGVRTDAAIFSVYGTDPADPSLPLYQRRWSVWQDQTAAVGGGVKLIAVSVTWRERALPRLREVVLLTHVSDQGLASSFASAFR